MTIGGIYRKALVRIDTSGVVSEDKGNDAADMGRLAQLISGDAGQIVNLPVILDAVVQGPINVLILGWFLYEVLGISAFVGYVMFFVVGFGLLTGNSSMLTCTRSGHSLIGL